MNRLCSAWFVATRALLRIRGCVQGGFMVFLEDLLRDLRDALRQLRKSPGFGLTAILTLAFGIGATTAIFSIVEGVLLRPLPFAAPARLVTLGDTFIGADFGGGPPSVTAAEVLTYTRDTQAFESLGGYRTTTY